MQHRVGQVSALSTAAGKTARTVFSDLARASVAVEPIAAVASSALPSEQARLHALQRQGLNATAHQDLEVQVPELEKQTAPFASIGPAVSGPACRSACQNLRCHPQTNLSQNAKVMHIRVFARRRRSVRSANGRYAHACGMELALVAIYTYMGVALVATRIHSAWN